MKLSEIYIKETKAGDLKDILEVKTLAFGHDKEAKLTKELLNDPTAKPYLSLLAFLENRAVGHILFTRIYINDSTDQPLMHILAPLAVIPEYQKKGIGGLLIKEGLSRLKAQESQMVFVLGHIDYYPRYGFIPDAGKLGYDAPYPIPEEVKDAWMVQSLNPEGFVVPKGKVICADKLNEPEHWRE